MNTFARSVALALAVLVIPSLAPAAALTWDATTTTVGAQDGVGTWNTTDTNWWNGAANTNWNNATPDAATFGVGTASTVSLGTAISVANMTFTNNYLIRSNTLTLVGTPTIDNVGSPTISSILAGSGFLKTNSGTLVLSGANTYTGVTTLAQGIIQANNNTALGRGTFVFANASVRLLMTNGVTITNAITIGPNAGVGGQGLIMPTANSTGTLTGPMTINNGAAGGGHFGTTAGALLRVNGAITSPAAIVQSRIGNIIFSGGGHYHQFIVGQDYTAIGAANGLSTNALLNIGGSGAATFDLRTFNQTLVGLTNINAGVNVTNRGAMATLTLNVATNTAYGGTILEAINLVKAGAATQTLSSGNSTFTGSVTIAGGELRVTAVAGGANSALGLRTSARTIAVQTNATFMMDVNNALGGAGQTAAGIQQIVVNAGAVRSTKYNALGNITLNGGTLTQASSSGLPYEGYQFIGTITVGGSAPSVITTTAAKGNHLRGGATTVIAVADVAAGTDLLINAPILNGSPDYAGVGSLEKTGAGTLLLAAANPFTGALNINGGTVVLDPTGSVAAATIAVASAGVFDASAFAAYTPPSGQTLQGAGTVLAALTMNSGTRLTPGGIGTPGTLTVTGDVVISAAAYTNFFDLTNSLTVGAGVNDLLQVGGVFEPNSSLVYINPIAPLVSGTYRLINYTGTKSTTFDPVVQGNTYRGQSWSLNDATPGQVDLIVTAGAAASLRWSADTSADWDLSTTNWTDTTSLLADRYFDYDSVLFDDIGGDSNEVNIVGLMRPAALLVDSASNYTFTGTGRIGDGFGPLTPVKTGPGSLTLRATNTFSGGLVVSNGMLIIGGNSVIGTGTVVIAGGQLAGDGGTWAVTNNLQLNAAVSLDSVGGALTVAGFLTGSGDFTKTGAGTVTLTADPPGNLWTGNLTVAAGTVSLTTVANAYPFGGAMASSRTVTVDSGATLSMANGADNALGENALGIMRLVVSNGTVLASRSLHARNIDMWGGSILANSAPADGLDLRTGAYLRVFSDPTTATIDTKVTLRGDTPVDVDDGLNAVDLAFTTNFAGNNSFLVKTNAGTMVLSGSTDNSGMKLRNDGGTTVLAKTSSATVHAVGFAGLGLVINDGTVQLGGSGGDQIYVNIDALIAQPGVLDFNGISEGFDELSGTGTVLNSASATFSTLTAGQNNGANFFFAGTIRDDAGQMALTKQGTGIFTLSGQNAYSGQTTLQTGTLVVAGSVTGSVAVLATNTTFMGTGTYAGDVIAQAGARLIPGSATSVGTFTLTSNVFLQAGVIVPFELTNTTTVGSGVNDLIAVGGGLEPLGATIQILPRAPLASGTYTLMTYGGAKGSTFATSVSNTTRKTLAIDETTPNQINLVVSGSYLDLKWNPQVSTNWDTVAADWLDTVGATNTTFLDGDNVTFDESGAVTNGVNLVGLRQPGSMTVEGASNYVIRGAGRLGGTMHLNKTGTGELTLGGTNTFTGPVTVSNGVLRLGGTGALGFTTNITIASGAQLNLNGISQAGYNYNITIAGAGPDGRGAIVNTNANIGANSSVKWLTLSGDATVGALTNTAVSEGARFDIANGGWIQGNGYTLTKVGLSPVSMRGGATNLQLVVAEGLVYAENVTNALGTNAIVQSGGILGAYGNVPGGILLTPVTLNGGTLSSRQGGGAVTWAGPITLASNSFVSTSPGNGYPEENITISGEISGPGSLTKISNNTLFVSATNSYLGGTIVAKGTLQIGTNSASGSVLGGIVVSNIGFVRYSRSDSFTLANTITGSGSLYVNVASGLVVDATASINLGGGIEVPKSGVGSLRIMPGALITSLNLLVGNDAGFPGTVVQHGGAVTVNSSLRVGHYSNETSLYVMASGSLVVTNETAANIFTAGASEPAGGLYVGTDGTGIMIVTGGTIRAGGIVMDNRADTVGTDLLAFEGGTITLGRWGIQGNASTLILLGGGVLGADTNWTGSRPMTLTGTNGPAIFDPAGWTVTGTGLLSGPGGLVKNGAGTLVLQPSMPDSYTGGTVVNGGVLQLSYANGTANLGTIRGALTVNSGAIARVTLEKGIGFANSPSGNVAVVTINDGLLDFTGIQGLGGGQTYFLNSGEIRSNLGVPTSTGGALRINASGTNWTLYVTATNAIPLISGRIALDTTNARFDVADSTNETDLAITATLTDGIFGNAANSLVKTNTGTMALHGIALYSGTTLVDGGRLLVQTTGAPGTGTNTLTVGSGGTLGGTGLVGGPVVSDGTVAPGASAGALTVGRDYTQNAGGTLVIELGGNVSGVTHDLLAVSNAANLAGALTVSLIDGFVPATNDVFLIISAGSVAGTFGSTTLPARPAGQGWFVDYQANAVVLTITSAPSLSGYDLAATVITNGLSGYGDDADGDGYANLLEYVTGGSLTNPGTQARMNGGRTNGVLALKFFRDTAATDATIYVEGSFTATNGADWVGIATNLAGSWGSATNVSEFGPSPVNVTVEDTDATATNRFLRLRVTRP